MFEQFFEGTTRSIYETGMDSPITNDKLDQAKSYDVREYANNVMLRCQTGVKGSELMDYLGIKAPKPVEVVKEKSIIKKLIKGKKK